MLKLPSGYHNGNDLKSLLVEKIDYFGFSSLIVHAIHDFGVFQLKL